MSGKRVIIRRSKRTGKMKGMRVVRNKRAQRQRRYRTYMNRRTGGFLGLELKFLDCAWNGVTIQTSTDGSGLELQPSTGCTGCISTPAIGTGENQRDGRKWTIKSIWVSGNINPVVSTDQTDVITDKGYFFALVLDTQCNGATIDSEDVYINPGTGAAAMLPQPLRNLQFSNRFRILDRQYVPPNGAYSMTDGTNTASLVPQNSDCVSLNWKGEILCEASGNTADVADTTTNAVHVIACTGGGFTANFQGKSRVRFMG